MFYIKIIIYICGMIIPNIYFKVKGVDFKVIATEITKEGTIDTIINVESRKISQIKREKLMKYYE